MLKLFVAPCRLLSQCVDVQNEMNDAIRLAMAFSDKLKLSVGVETLWEIIISNRASGRGTPCASHDYCDAADAMRDAWESIWSEPFDWDNALVEAAWRIARRNEFGF